MWFVILGTNFEDCSYTHPASLKFWFIFVKIGAKGAEMII